MRSLLRRRSPRLACPPDARAFTAPHRLLSSSRSPSPPPPSNSKKATALAPRPVRPCLSFFFPPRLSLRHVGAPPAPELRREPRLRAALPSPPPPASPAACHAVPAPARQPRPARLRLDPPPPPHPQPAAADAPLRSRTTAGFAPAPPPPLHEHDAVSNRNAGFGPFRWSPRPLRDAPVGAWDAVPAHGGGPPMMSPFFRSQPPPLSAVGEFAPVRTAIGFGGGGFPGLSSRAIVDVNPHSSWLAPPAAGSAYQNHAVDMVPIRNSHDLHVRHHAMIPRTIPRRAPPSFSSPSDEPFSYWNMGRFQRSTTTSSISQSQVAAAPDNFVKKRNADSNGFHPLKFRKLSRAG